MSTFTVNGKEWTVEQIAEIRRQAAEADKVVKAAEKAGFIEKAKKAPKEKAEIPAEVIALRDALQTVFEAHIETIKAEFAKTVTEEKPLGQIGINLSFPGGEWGVQLLNETTRKAKTPKKEKAAEETKTE